MADRYGIDRSASALALGGHVVDWTANVGANDLPSDAKAVFFDADGTCTVSRAGGGSSVPGVTFSKNNPLLFVPGRVTAMATATKCFVVIP